MNASTLRYFATATKRMTTYNNAVLSRNLCTTRTARIAIASSFQSDSSVIRKNSNDILHRFNKRELLTTSSSFAEPLPLLEEVEEEGPSGDLFRIPPHPPSSLVEKTAYVCRTFSPRSNAQAMLTCGGPILAKHASFDPHYDRAKDWIRHRPVGSAVLSPVLIGGLVGALVEAALPASVVRGSSIHMIRPPIVGVEMEARITVTSVEGEGSNNHNSHCTTTTAVATDSARQEEDNNNNDKVNRVGDNNNDDTFQWNSGYNVLLDTQVTRKRDGAFIARGTHTVWIPN